jgi:hypothetical protein
MSGELLARVESRVRAEVGELVGDAYFDGFMDRHRPRLRELLANAEAQRRASMRPLLQGYVEGFAELWVVPTSPTTWAEAVTTGSKLARTLLAVRQPPTRAKARALTAASKAFMTARSTRNTYRWYERNKKHGFLLLEAANSWEPIPQGTDLDLPFAVHWQPDLPLDREHTRGLLRRAVEAIRGSDVPRLTEVLYGPVYVVGALAGRTRLAWYYPDLDTVFVRYRGAEADADGEFIHSVIHELGHRYWGRIMTAEQHREWERHHRRVAQGVRAGTMKWPTAYSAKNAEEHSCEVLGLRHSPCPDRNCPGHRDGPFSPA